MRETKKKLMLWWLEIKSPAAAAVGGGARGSLCSAVQSDQRDKRAEWSRADFRFRWKG